MTATGYDEIAEWYDNFVRELPIYEDVVLPALMELTGEVRGQEVCDVACGQGLATRQLAKSGARVTGIDVAPNLLALAQQHEDDESFGIRYVLDDAHMLGSLSDSTFNGVTCNMALMNIAKVPDAFRAIWRILRPGGWFVFSITHPCFEAPHSKWVTRDNGEIVREVANYFDEGVWWSDNPRGVRHRVGDEHRMLSTYINELVETGFALERMLEPPGSGKWAERVPGTLEIPTILLMRSRKGPG